MGLFENIDIKILENEQNIQVIRDVFSNQLEKTITKKYKTQKITCKNQGNLSQ